MEGMNNQCSYDYLCPLFVYVWFSNMGKSSKPDLPLMVTLPLICTYVVLMTIYWYPCLDLTTKNTKK